jgi:hypothetical protein
VVPDPVDQEFQHRHADAFHLEPPLETADLLHELLVLGVNLTRAPWDCPRKNTVKP